MSNRFSSSYILSLQFLGFRYHGWQKQSNVKTIHLMLDKTLNSVLGEDTFKTLGAGRTDAMVSAMDFKCELMLNHDLPKNFLTELNKNLPQDIKLNSVEMKNKNFNIIQDIKHKEYHYHFSLEEKMNPLTAPYLAHIKRNINIDLLSKACSIFEGEHNFKSFTETAQQEKDYSRKVNTCRVLNCVDYLPCLKDEVFHTVCFNSKGFLRYQIRYMMGALFSIGAGTISINQVLDELSNPKNKLTKMAPASGLTLYKTNL